MQERTPACNKNKHNEKERSNDSIRTIYPGRGIASGAGPIAFRRGLRRAADHANPRPSPPSFETCKAVGNGTIGQGDITGNEGLVDTDIVCGSGPSAFHIFDSGINHESAIHYYNDAGKLTRSVSHDNWSSTQWSNPLADTTLPYIQHMVFTDILAVPGDLNTATNTVQGEVIFKPAHSQPIVLGVGKQIFAPDGTLQFSAGHFIDLNSPELLPICAALA